VSSAVDWAFAEKLACKMSGKDLLSDSYHAINLESDFAEFTSQAEELVAAETGLVSTAGAARGRVTDRPGWIRANIASFQRLMKPVLGKFDAENVGPLGPVVAKAAGAEVGAMLGWMSGRVLGQYDLLVIEDEAPEEQDIVYYVGPNVLALEQKHKFAPREFRLWLALHEVTHRAQFTGVPWMREHFLGLVDQMLVEAEPDPARIFTAIGRVSEAVLERKNPLEDGGVAVLFASDEQKALMDQIGGLMSLLEGHGDVTMDRAGVGLVPSAEHFGEVLRTRRNETGGAAKFLQQLVGLQAKLAQYQQGEDFIEAVEAHGGTRLIDLAWQDPANLPSLLEIRDPSLWIARVAKPMAASLRAG